MNKRDWQSMPQPQFADYKSTVLRTPQQMPIHLPKEILEKAVVKNRPVFREMTSNENDLTMNGRVNGEPIGLRILVLGQVRDENNRGIPNTLVEIWQANSGGRYIHKEEIHPSPIDPNFLGAGRTITDKDGNYKFITIQPGSYPWGNHYNAWRPAHIHFSIWGQGFAQRLITQMYFEGDPTLKFDPIFNSVSDVQVRNRMIAKFSMENTVPEWAHAYIYNITLRGSEVTPFEN